MMFKNKTPFSILMIISVLSILFYSSCDKETTDDLLVVVTPSVSCNIDSVAWTTSVAGGVGLGTYVVTATYDSQAIVLTMPDKIVGVNTIDGLNVMASFVPELDSASNAYIAYKGTIEITDLNFTNTQFNGTFNFEAVNALFDTIIVTDGVLKNIPTK